MVTPLDPRATGVADYSLDLLPHLARAARAKIHVYSDTVCPSGEGWTWHAADELGADAAGHDLIIYQMGNSPAHDFMAPYLFRYPGLVVLHDPYLHDFYVRRARAGHTSVYVRALGFGYGVEGTALARRYLRNPLPVEYPHYLASEWLAARSLGVIVHSQHAADLLGSRCPSARIWAVPHLVHLPPHVMRETARRQLSIAQQDYVIVVFGRIAQSKCPVEILEALHRLRADGIPARVVFIGEENSEFRLAPDIERLGLDHSVTHLGFVSWAVAEHWMFAADVAVGLRQRYFGETSGAALRILATGIPMIVTQVGAFAELPDQVCLKLPFCDPQLEALLAAALKKLYLDPERRQAMGKAAREYVASECDPDRIAALYMRVVEAIAGKW